MKGRVFMYSLVWACPALGCLAAAVFAPLLLAKIAISVGAWLSFCWLVTRRAA